MLKFPRKSFRHHLGDGNGYLDRAEFDEYLLPMVQVMEKPPELVFSAMFGV